MLNPAIRNSLQASAFQYPLDNHELEVLLSYNKTLTFATGEMILQQGKNAQGIYIILEGVVEVTAKILGPGVANIERLPAGNFFGEISFVEDCPCSTSVVALEATQCLLMNSLYLELIAKCYPETRYKIMHAVAIQVCQRLKAMHDKIIAFINQANMTKRSFFGDILHAFITPGEITLQEANIEITQFRDSPFFKSFNNEEVDELFKHVSCVSAEKHYHLIDAGDKNADCYIVIHGAVQSSIVHDNKSAKLSVIGPGILFAGTSFIDTTTELMITFTTCEKAVLLKLSKSKLDLIRHQMPSLWYKLFYLSCRSLIALEKSIDKLDLRLQVEIYNR